MLNLRHLETGEHSRSFNYWTKVTFLGSPKLQIYILNVGPARGKRFFASDRGGNGPCTYRALFSISPPGGAISAVKV